MTIAEALKIAERLKEQECITPIAQALEVLAEAWWKEAMWAQDQYYGTKE